MGTLFSAKLVESQLPVLTRRSKILKRVMWSGIGIVLAGIIPTLYFSYSATDVNAVSHFVYDFPQSLLTWSENLSAGDSELILTADINIRDILNVLSPLTLVMCLVGMFYGFICQMQGKDGIGIMVKSGGIAVLGGALNIWLPMVLTGDSHQIPSVEEKLAVAFRQRDAINVLKVMKENPDFLNNHVSGHTDVTKFFEDLGYLEIQKDIKEGHVNAIKIKSFVQSSYFSRGIKTFRPDALTAIEKAAYGHPVSERAEHYQTSVIEPEIQNKHMLATISASLMTLGFISGIGAFLLSRSIRRRVSFLQALLAGEALSL